MCQNEKSECTSARQHDKAGKLRAACQAMIQGSIVPLNLVMTLDFLLISIHKSTLYSSLVRAETCSDPLCRSVTPELIDLGLL
jgi:hypothetical protein